ncbi:fungal-specific transcription factor domain-containing protein [Lyophyllum atratum]|nr:fungal-specific transcription factor domain-containing protein [Lyophyllum atratum]
MSSDDEGSTEKLGQDSKRRRIQRACDVCRRKKIRCDGVQMPGNNCTNCMDYGLTCTYVEAAKKRGPPKSYVEKLENRVERLRSLIAKISPEALERLDDLSDTPVLASGSSNSLTQLDPKWHPHDPAPGRFIRHLGSNTAPPVGLEDDTDNFLTDHLEKLRLDTNDHRFFGKSSGLTLIKTALELKREYMGTREGGGGTHDQDGTFSGVRRPWAHPLPSPALQPPRYIYPPPDLLASLIDLYFVHVNRYLPLLHRPTFDRAVARGLHQTDAGFATILLLLCAVAGRYSDDPRVMDDPEDDMSGEERRNAHSCGWKWFVQVSLVKVDPLSAPSLYDLQFYALVGQFLQASSVPQACWTIVGVGIRVAQDVGAHRRKTQDVHTVEDELWKRAFWVLVCMDRLFSSSLGRPCSILDEDFDIDMPIECDDEYWEHPDPELRWRQPTPHKTPSIVVYFNVYIRLNQILAFLLRTVYAINKSKILLGFVGQQWEENIVAELDSALNAWVDNLPDHLRWDPTRTNDIFFNQSASLHCAYYHIQILVHRPFIPSPRKPNAALSFPSLAICTNAARACSHVLAAQGKRFKVAPQPLQTTAFSAGVVLLLSIWGGRRSGLSTDFAKEMGDVQKCMDVLKASESRWYLAGRLRDILCELASVGDLPLPQRSSNSPTSAAQKREREPEDDKANASTPVHHANREAAARHVYVEPEVMDATRSIAGRSTRRQVPSLSGSASGSGSALPVLPSPLSQQPLYTLPEYDFETNPVYHQRQPPPSHQAQHGIISPPNWYGPPSGHRESTRGQNQAITYAPANPYATQQRQFQGQSHLHVQPPPSSTTSIPGSSSNFGSTYYAPSAADLEIMSPFALQSGGGTGAGYRQEHPYPYRVGHTSGGMLGAGLRTGDGGRGLGGGMDVNEGGSVRMGGDTGLGTGNSMAVDGTFAMWSEAPAGFELNEWGNYLSNMSSPPQQGHAHGHGHFHGPAGA